MDNNSSMRFPTPSQFQTPSQFDFGDSRHYMDAVLPSEQLGSRFVIPQFRSNRITASTKNTEKLLRGEFEKLKENAFRTLEDTDWIFGTESHDFTQVIPEPLPFEGQDKLQQPQH